MSESMDEAMARALVDGARLHVAWRISLGDMWDEVERVLGRRVTVLTDEQRKAIR